VEYARYNPEIFYVFAINSFLEKVNASLFMTYPVSNFTFDGIYDSILEGADSTSGIELPLPNDKFGWFYLVSILKINNSFFLSLIYDSITFMFRLNPRLLEADWH